MWAMLQAAGAVLAKFGAKNPAVKWGVIALVGLFAVEFAAKEAISVWVTLGTAQATVDQKNAEAEKARLITDGKNYNMLRDFDYCKLPASAKETYKTNYAKLGGKAFVEPNCN